jgi:tetratricopeptide (TPR) repeat protein
MPDRLSRKRRTSRLAIKRCFRSSLVYALRITGKKGRGTMSMQRMPEPPAEGTAVDEGTGEQLLNVILSPAPEPFAGEETLPALSAPLPPLPVPPEAASAGMVGYDTAPPRQVALQPGGWIERLGYRFSPRHVRLIVLGLGLLLLVLIVSAWSTSAAGLIYPDWGLASLRVGLVAALLGAVLLLLYQVIWRARVQPRPVSAGVLGLVLVVVGASGIVAAAPLHRLQGLWFEGQRSYALALASYQESGDSLAQSQDMARISVEWAEQLSGQHQYQDAVAQLEPVVRSYRGDAALETRARMDLIHDYLAWGDQALQQGSLRAALAHYQALQEGAYCDAACQAQVRPRAAQALLALAQQLVASKQYDQAVATYQLIAHSYSDTPDAEQANQALSAPQTLTGKLVFADKTPAKGFQVLLASRWNFNTSTQVFTLQGQQYRTQTDAAGVFVVPLVAVGMTYMLAWIDTGGHAGTCVTTSNQPLYLVQMQPLRAADVGMINIECV